MLALATLWASMSLTAFALPGCYGRNCDGSLEVFGAEEGQGMMIDENTWTSNPHDGEWLWFPRQRYYVFDVRALGGRTPSLVIPYLSATPTQSTEGANFTIGSGNIAEFFNALPNRIDLKNDTCSDYYLRLYIEVPPLPPSDSMDGASNDAGTDATVDESDDAGP